MFHAVQITLQHGRCGGILLLYLIILPLKVWTDNGTLYPIFGARGFRADDRGIP